MTTNPTATAATAAPEEKFALTSSRHFPDWLARTCASLAFTTYQAGKVFLIGLKPGGAAGGVRAHLRALHGAGH
jgi:hypothetical protein